MRVESLRYEKHAVWRISRHVVSPFRPLHAAAPFHSAAIVPAASVASFREIPEYFPVIPPVSPDRCRRTLLSRGRVICHTPMVHLRGGRSRTTPRRGKLDALHQAIDDLAHGDAFSMADADSIIELNHLSARLEGVRTATLAKVRTPVTEAVFARDEAYLVGQAKELKFEALVAVLAYWLQHADPDGADEADMERRARRDVYLTPSLHGMVLGAMTLDPIGGSIVADELFRLEQVCSLRVLRPPGREVPDRPHRALE
jgi:hypothetical protein